MADPIVLDGKALARSTEVEIAERVANLKARNGGRTPILATVLVGTDPASAGRRKNGGVTSDKVQPVNSRGEVVAVSSQRA